MIRFIYNKFAENDIAESREVSEDLREIAEAILERARANAPVDEGTYRDSLEVVIENGEIRVVSTDPKAHIIEWGSIDTPTFAVLRRSAEQIVGTSNVRG